MYLYLLQEEEKVLIGSEHFTEAVRISSGVCKQTWEECKSELPGKRLPNPFGEISIVKIREIGCESLEEYVLSHCLALD